MTEFEKYAISSGISSNTLDGYKKTVNGIISPVIIEERPSNMVTMDVFSALARDRIIYLSSEINGDVASIVNAQLMFYDSMDPNLDIKMYINSPGGSVIDGLAIYDVMNLISADVETNGIGMAASMGSILLSSGTKGKRYCLPHSRVMIHQVSSGFKGQCSDMEIAIQEAKKYQSELYSILSENTGKSIEEIAKDADRDHWFTAPEALEYGLIDHITKKKTK